MSSSNIIINVNVFLISVFLYDVQKYKILNNKNLFDLRKKKKV